MHSKVIPIMLIAAVVLVAGCAQAGQKMAKAPTPTSTPTPAVSSPTTSPVATPSPSISASTQSPSPAATQAAGVKTFSFSITHNGYAITDGSGASVTELKVIKGDTVKMLATSTPQAHNHGITIDEFNINVAVRAEPGSTPQEITFVADKAGAFTIYCKTCGQGILGDHPWMKANLIVQ